MFRLIVHWVISAVAIMFVSRVVPGFYITSMQSAFMAALAIGFLNATLGFALKVITFPIAILTFGIFLLVINAAMIMMASRLVSGFYVYGWTPAFSGAVVLAVISMLIKALAKE